MKIYKNGVGKMFCRKCGKEMQDERIKCPYCGCNLKEDGSEDVKIHSEQKVANGSGKVVKKGRKKCIIVAIILCMIALAGVFGGGR